MCLFVCVLNTTTAHWGREKWRRGGGIWYTNQNHRHCERNYMDVNVHLYASSFLHHTFIPAIQMMN